MTESDYPRPVITTAKYPDDRPFGNGLTADVIKAIPDRDVRVMLAPSHRLYDDGEYEQALAGFNAIIALEATARDVLWPFVEICRRVTSFPINSDDLTEAKAHDRWAEAKRRWPTFLFRRFFKATPPYARCKYCARYIGYLPPDEGKPVIGGVLGAYVGGNQCPHCDRSYPMPSFYWDSVRGQAYIFYRRSVTEHVFYREFVRRFDVKEFNDDKFVGGHPAPGLGKVE
jgi:hypothetical protein